MEKTRLQILDFFRGIAICDMILVHFSGYFPVFVGNLLSYTDMAMEGFVFLSGFMIGQHYYGKYLEDGRRATRRLIGRALQILLIQYFLVLTINLPLYYLVYRQNNLPESAPVFLLKSMLLLNQIGIMHILPTFIPLFLISPLILYSLSKRLHHVAIVLSIVFFAIGNRHPYFPDLGEKTIFPFILWQIYFVAGCLLGKKAYLLKKIGPENIKNYFCLSIVIFSAAMFIKHGKVIPPSLTSKFPLNALGLLYGSSLLFIVYTFTMKYWCGLLSRVKLFGDYVPLFGRHSLLVFVIHIYTAKYILLLNYRFHVNFFLNVSLILLSLILIWRIVEWVEFTRKGSHPCVVLDLLR